MTWTLIALIISLPVRPGDTERQYPVKLALWSSDLECEDAGRKLATIYSGPYFRFEWRCEGRESDDKFARERP